MVFRSPKRTASWTQRPSGALDFLIEYGEIEAALVDRLSPEMDDWTPEIERLRRTSQAAGRAVCSGRELPEAPVMREAVTVSVPEGYAYYGLDPQTYVAAARKFWMDTHPREVVCIGIRSIGTSLSAIVGAALEERGARVHSFTVRPHGHPFNREVSLSAGLQELWRGLGEAYFAVIDEGPGLSGSSFASVAGKLGSLGIPDDRIVLFPSWMPDGSGFVSETAREQWRRHRKYATEFPLEPGWTDLSAGKWREYVYNDRGAAPKVQPQHEARKYLVPHGGRSELLKFEGLGRYGRARFERAALLADAGFSPRVLGLDDGFVRSEFVAGQPLSGGVRDAELFETMARYLAFRVQHLAADEVTPVSELASMTVANTGAEAPTGHVEKVVIADGRLQGHEWLATARGYLKTDAVDHGDNHFYPGPTDIAWDVAGVIAEFALDGSEAADFTELYIRHSHDRTIHARLPFFRAAYSAFRTGYRRMYDC